VFGVGLRFLITASALIVVIRRAMIVIVAGISGTVGVVVGVEDSGGVIVGVGLDSASTVFP